MTQKDPMGTKDVHAIGYYHFLFSLVGRNGRKGIWKSCYPQNRLTSISPSSELPWKQTFRKRTHSYFQRSLYVKANLSASKGDGRTRPKPQFQSLILMDYTSALMRRGSMQSFKLTEVFLWFGKYRIR